MCGILFLILIFRTGACSVCFANKRRCKGCPAVEKKPLDVVLLGVGEKGKGIVPYSLANSVVAARDIVSANAYPTGQQTHIYCRETNASHRDMNCAVGVLVTHLEVDAEKFYVVLSP